MSSTIAVAIDGLLAQLSASEALTGVTVFDGPPLAKASEWVAVGYQPDEAKAVTAGYDWAQIGAQRSEEEYDILCSLATRSGSTKMSVGRARAVAIRDAVAAAISTDRTLGGAVRLAGLSSADLLQEQTASGRIVGFTFTVHCTARITT